MRTMDCEKCVTNSGLDASQDGQQTPMLEVRLLLKMER